jgi:peptide/nickel transport system permease protein
MASLFDTLNQSLWVWLATDVLLWALFVLFLVSVVIILRSPLQRAVWQRVFRQRLAVVSAVLLAVAACFALLDSIHLREPLPQTGQQTSVRYSVEVRSVLDLILADLRKSHEKTYSAPMATHLSALEPVTVLLPDGTMEVRREAPRLRVAGSSFPPGPITQEDYWRDIVFRVFIGALAGGLVFAALGLIGYGVKRLLGQRGRADRSTASIWRWVGTTLGYSSCWLASSPV